MAKSKLSASHSTFIPMADAIRRFAEKLPEVTRVGSGMIVVAGRGLASVKISDGGGAILLQVRGQAAVQDVRIYSKDHGQTIADLKTFFSERRWKVREQELTT